MYLTYGSYDKAKKAGLNVPKERVEEFITELTVEREVGVMRTLMELMKKTDYSEVLFFYSFWYAPPSPLFPSSSPSHKLFRKWIMTHQDSDQAKALEDIFAGWFLSLFFLLVFIFLLLFLLLPFSFSFPFYLLYYQRKS